MSEQDYLHFYMDTDLLKEALDKCDLGDGYMAKVRKYPHKDMIPELTSVVEYSMVKQLEDEKEQIIKINKTGFDLRDKLRFELGNALRRIENLKCVLDKIDEIAFQNGYHSVTKIAREAIEQDEKEIK